MSGFGEEEDGQARLGGSTEVLSRRCYGSPRGRVQSLEEVDGVFSLGPICTEQSKLRLPQPASPASGGLDSQASFPSGQAGTVAWPV